jgi:hypothetical protein
VRARTVLTAAIAAPPVGPDAHAVNVRLHRAPCRRHRAVDGAGTPTQIGKGPRRDRDPAYSPDGRFVIWSNAGAHDLWIANARGGGAQVFTHQPGWAKDPSWGPAPKK